MKELLKNRNVAIGVTVVVIIMSTMLGSHRSLMAAAYPVEKYFVEGEDGYSIQRDLDARLGLANNLLIVAKRYLLEDDLTLVDLKDAITTLEDADSVKEKAVANQQLTAATERMDLLLEEYPLSNSDERYRIQIHTDLVSCNQKISHSEYNEMVIEYNTKVLGRFPANLLKRIAMVSELDTF